VGREDLSRLRGRPDAPVQAPPAPRILQHLVQEGLADRQSRAGRGQILRGRSRRRRVPQGERPRQEGRWARQGARRRAPHEGAHVPGGQSLRLREGQDRAGRRRRGDAFRRLSGRLARREGRIIMASNAFIDIFRVKELRQRILYTLMWLTLFRLGTFLPIPGINASALQSYFASQNSSGAGGITDYLDFFAGGA